MDVDPPGAGGVGGAAASRAMIAGPTATTLGVLLEAAAKACEAPLALVALAGARTPPEEGRALAAAWGFDPAATPEAPSSSPTPWYEPYAQAVEAHRGLQAIDELTEGPTHPGRPVVRASCGVVLADSGGTILGTLLVLDHRPRAWSSAARATLTSLAHAAACTLERQLTTGDALPALQHGREELQAALDATPAMIGYWDKALRSVFANRAYAARFGHTPASLRGMQARAALGPELYALNEPFITEALAGAPQSLERELRGPGGELRRYLVHYAPDVRGGQVRGVTVVASEVTPLLRALDTARRHNVMLQLSERVAHLGHWRLIDGVHVECSPGLHALLGHGAPAFDRCTVTDLVAYLSPSAGPQLTDAIERAQREGVGFELDVARGEQRLVVVGQPDVGEPAGVPRPVFGVVLDVTDRERRRQLESRTERLVTTGLLAAGVGHEINNPLAFILNNLEYARDELRAQAAPAPAELLGALDEARDGVDRIRRIVYGLRALGEPDAPPVPTRLGQVLDLATRLAGHELKHRALLRVDVEATPAVLADETRLAQVFVNLLLNASQAFARASPATNLIHVRAHATPRHTVQVEVEDNGPGIAPEVLPRIFDPFFTTKPIGTGTGLGLAVSHSIVTGFGGQLTVATRLGHGTTFTVELPEAR
jgi:two-component system NtrC family sensor kinase